VALSSSARIDRRRFAHDPLERARRDAEARRHADAFDARKLPEVRALAADDRDLRRVDLLKAQHTHRTAPFAACGERVWSTPRGLKQAPPAAILWM
jgi:hypothetical protein